VNHKATDSPIWSDLLKIKEVYLQGRGVEIRNGLNTRFWIDPWLYDKPLCYIVPILYILCDQKDVCVAHVKTGKILITFRRWLTHDLEYCWNLIWVDVSRFQLQDSNDVVVWKNGKSNKFSVRSMYNLLTKSDAGPAHKKIWKGRVPPKIKIFMWLMTNDALLTKDNMIRRKWAGDPKCYFCDHDETINHLFFTCPIAKVVWGVIAKLLGAMNIPTSLGQCWEWCDLWLPMGGKFHLWGISAICWAIWKARNRACFERKIIRNPIEIICHAGALMQYWTGLYAEVDRKMLKVATDLLLQKESVGDKNKRLKYKDHRDDGAQN
jgi:hypothetical protein